jgi:hypothetical protein
LKIQNDEPSQVIPRPSYQLNEEDSLRESALVASREENREIKDPCKK